MRRILIRLLGWEDCVTQMVLQEVEMKLSTFDQHCLLRCMVVVVVHTFIDHPVCGQDLLFELGALQGAVVGWMLANVVV